MNKSRSSGFTLVEIMMIVVIVGIALSIVIGTLAGMRSKDTLGRAAQQIHDDLIQMRSLAVARFKTYHMKFLSDTSWVLEYYDTSQSPAAWVIEGVTHSMPTNTNLMTGSLANAGSNLEATSRGIYLFQNGATGTPYVSLESLGASETKSIYVYTGGAIEIRTQ